MPEMSFENTYFATVAYEYKYVCFLSSERCKCNDIFSLYSDNVLSLNAYENSEKIGRPGFEPGSSGPEPDVLPLN